MSAKFGRCDTGSDPMDGPHSGNQVSFSGWLVGTSVDDLKARWQQMVGLTDNPDEQIIPCTFSHDSTFDGFYTPTSVNVTPVQGVGYVGSPRTRYSITLERMPGFASPLFETIVQSVVRTNAHSITIPPSVIGASIGAVPTAEVDFRPSLTGATVISRPNNDAGSTTARVYTIAAPQTVTSWRGSWPPAQYYWGAARIEVKYGSTWYPVTGRNVPANSIWRISNGNVRLTSAQGATSGTLEVWDGTSWDSANVSHWTNGAVGPGIGVGNGTSQATVNVLRNSPEQVTVRCCGATNEDWTYTLQRGAHIVVASWSSQSAFKYGGGYTTTTACSTLTGGLRKTTNDAGGNRLVFSMPVAQTTDTTNGGTNASTAAQSGTVMFGVELAGSSAISGNAGADLINQFIGATSWRQQVVPR